jgi:bacteriocin biosynthesis cyclodehydratase domain-containing protein
MTKPVQFLTLGAFGRAVAARAAQPGDYIDDFPLEDTAALAQLIERAGFVALASWRPYVAAFQALANLCHQQGRAWCFAEIHGRHLTVSPLFAPNGKGCHDCYRRRWGAQHAASEWETALQSFYGRHLHVGPEGYSPPAVAFAAAALTMRANAAANPGSEKASTRLLVVDVLFVSVVESEVTPVHGCPVCFPRTSQTVGERFTAHLAPAVKELLS